MISLTVAQRVIMAACATVTVLDVALVVAGADMGLYRIAVIMLLVFCASMV